MRTIDGPLEEADLPPRVVSALRRAGARCLRDAIGISPEDLLRQRNFDVASLRALEDRLSEHGLVVGFDLEATRDALYTRATLESAPDPVPPPDLDLPLGSLYLGGRLERVLGELEVGTLREAARLREEDILAVPTAGHGTVRELRQRLSELGLALRGDPEAAGDPMAVLEMPIAQIGLSKRLRTALDRLGARTLIEASMLTRDQILDQRGVGERTVAELVTRLAKHGLGLV